MWRGIAGDVQGRTGAECQVVQDSVEAMRQECTERWVRGTRRREEALQAV